MNKKFTKTLKEIVAGAVLTGALTLQACSGYNLRMATIMIDKRDKPDTMVGIACLGNNGSYRQIGALNFALDNPWYSKITPLFNSHTEAQEQDATTLQFGSIGYSQGSCFQFNYLGFGEGKVPFSPIMRWHSEKK